MEENKPKPIFGVRVKTQSKSVMARYRYEDIHKDMNVHMYTYVNNRGHDYRDVGGRITLGTVIETTV
jgi:hypothetical protein